MIISEQKIRLGVSILSGAAVALALIVVAGGPGAHLGVWTPLDGFILSLLSGFIGGLILSLIALVFMVVTKMGAGRGRVILVFITGLLLAAPVGYLVLSGGGGVPPIHDITTNLVSPPQFIALVGKRGEKANSLDGQGGEVAALQQEFYPDIVPLLVSDEPQKAFATALDVAHSLGWEVVDQAATRFEATDTSLWFAFVDDVVVTIQGTGTGSRIDLRSVSRVGVSDLGVNAGRIRRFQQKYAALTLTRP